MSARIHTPLARILTVATALALVFGLGSSLPGMAAPTVAASPATVSIDCPQTTMVPYSEQNCTITVSAADAAPEGFVTVTRSMLANYPYPPCTLTPRDATSSTCPILVGAWAGPADGSLTATYTPTDGHAPASGTISITTA